MTRVVSNSHRILVASYNTKNVIWHYWHQILKRYQWCHNLKGCHVLIQHLQCHVLMRRRWHQYVIGHILLPHKRCHILTQKRFVRMWHRCCVRMWHNNDVIKSSIDPNDVIVQKDIMDICEGHVALIHHKQSHVFIQHQ